MTNKKQTKPVQENDNEEMETSPEENELVKPSSHAETISTKQVSDADSGSEKDVDSESKTDKQVSTVAAVPAVVAEEPKNKKARGSGVALPSAAFSTAHAAAAAARSRKSETIKKMKEKVEEEDREVSLTFGEDWFEKSFLVGSFVSFGMDEESVKKRWVSVPIEKKKETEWKWKVLHLEELRFQLSKHELEYEVASALANATP